MELNNLKAKIFELLHFNRKAEEDSKWFTSIETELVKLKVDMNDLRGGMILSLDLLRGMGPDKLVMMPSVDEDALKTARLLQM
ncbi:MAG: hypothetical protein QW424_03115 [Candidatus Bathyarchaeia archaeon]